MKKNILSFILGGVIFSTIIVGANILYKAKDVQYLSDKTNVTNVQDAMNELYIETSHNKGSSFGCVMGQSLSFIETKDLKKLEINVYRNDSTNDSYPGYLKTIILGFKANSIADVKWGSDYSHQFSNSEELITVSGTTDGFLDLSEYLDEYDFIGVTGYQQGSKNFFELRYN